MYAQEEGMTCLIKKHDGINKIRGLRGVFGG